VYQCKEVLAIHFTVFSKMALPNEFPIIFIAWN